MSVSFLTPHQFFRSKLPSWPNQHLLSVQTSTSNNKNVNANITITPNSPDPPHPNPLSTPFNLSNFRNAQPHRMQLNNWYIYQSGPLKCDANYHPWPRGIHRSGACVPALVADCNSLPGGDGEDRWSGWRDLDGARAERDFQVMSLHARYVPLFHILSGK